MTLYCDREDGGRQLVPLLQEYANRDDVVVVGLPRGGVITAAEVAKALHLPLDITCPRKIGYPGNPEYAIGAVSEAGEYDLNQKNIPEENLREEIALKQQEAKKRPIAKGCLRELCREKW